MNQHRTIAGASMRRHAAIAALLACLPFVAACSHEPATAAEMAPPAAVVAEQATDENRAVTYGKDVAPILHARCAECHRPGAVAPFSLLTYEDAAKRAEFIKEVVSDRRMPPWHGDSKDFAFLDSRRLPESEIKTLARWADTGAEKGPPAPPLPSLPEVGAWSLGKPDVVIELKEVELPADGRDVYKYFVVAIPVTETRYLKAIEFRPGNPAVVHHANMNLDTAGELNDMVGQAVTTGAMGVTQVRLEPLSGMLGIWTPGLTPRLLPEGYGHAIEPKTNMVVNVHYNLTGKPETDRSQVGLYFTDEPQEAPFQLLLNVSRQAGNLQLLNIPAGEERHVVKLTRTLPFDSRLYATQVHGHFLLKESELTATLPDGKVLELLKVDDWDFNWQERYLYESRPLLPAGTRIDLVSVFDNSDKNPQNPNAPPKAVRFGPSSTDEMCGAGLVLLPEGLKEFEVPADGLKIPPSAKRLTEFDLDKDGRLSKAELDAMPSRRRMMLQLTYARIQQGGAADIPEFAGPPEGPEPFEFPEGGIALPEQAALVRERFDKDQDGTLSREEFDAAPEGVRRQLETMLTRGAPSRPKPSAPAEGTDFPEEGLALPEQAALVRERFDLDKDGKLSRKEFDAAPEAVRKQLELMLRGGGGAAPPAASSSASNTSETSALKLPSDGLPFPEQATVLRERFDENGNNRLDQKEFDAMPASIRERLAPLIQKKLSETKASAGSAAPGP